MSLNYELPGGMPTSSSYNCIFMCAQCVALQKPGPDCCPRIIHHLL